MFWFHVFNYVFLLYMQLEFFTTFKAKHPEASIRFTKFHLLKPCFVRRLIQWNTCCYRYHMELIYFMEGLNEQRMGKKGTHFGCACACWGVCGRGCTLRNSCVAKTTCFSRLSTLCNSVLCTKANSTSWHNLNCLLGTCEEYGPEKMFWVCSIEQSSIQIIKWKQFGKQVTRTTEDGKERNHVKVEYMEGTPTDLIDRLKSSLKFFVTHNFLAR
jgi:hypothetical protein